MSPQDRRNNLQEQLASRNINTNDLQNRRSEIREDWQDRYQNFYGRHEDWHHGCWHGNASDLWHHMWDEHTGLMAFGTTMWGVNRSAYTFGYWGYSNPYYVEPYPIAGGVALDYSQPVYAESTAAASAPSQASAEAPAPGMTEFDAARQAFYQKDYAAALKLTDKALAILPKDPIIHEFRALVLFALGKYQEAAAGLHSVLAVGPGWDWTTLSSLYADVAVYTQQLRALEEYLEKEPRDTAARFVLAYHYVTMGYKDTAAEQLRVLYKATPQDTVIKELLLMTAGPEGLGATAATTPAPSAPTATANRPAVKAADLVGTWKATGGQNTGYTLELMADGNFKWTFTQAGKPQTVQGVYALDGNVLALEPSTGGVMLADVAPPQNGSFHFVMSGAPQGDPGLDFTRER